MSDVFEPRTLSNGAFLWSNPNNWSNGVPLNGENATVVLDSDQRANDDVPSLTLSVVSNSDGFIAVTGETLSIGTIVNNTGNGLQIEADSTAGAATPVTVTVGSISGNGGQFTALGQDAFFVDNSPTNPEAFYGAFSGGTVLLDAAPASDSTMRYEDPATFALEHPGATVAADLGNVLPGDVLELPGTTVTSLSFGADSLTIATNSGTTTFSNFETLYPITGYTAGFDPNTGLEAITFIGPDIFEDNVSDSSGSLEGDYLWSNPQNWSDDVVPVNGDSVTVVSANGDTAIDDIAALSLTNLTLTGTGTDYLYVTGGSLSIGTLDNTRGNNFQVEGYSESGASTPVTITVGSISSSGGYYFANGQDAFFVDNAPTVSGGNYGAYDGGTVLFYAAPSSGSGLFYDGIGTFALENPGAQISANLDHVLPGDVLELPGTTVSSLSFGASSLTIATNAGTTTFSNFSTLYPVTGYTTGIDPDTGLEAITFIGPDLFENNVSASSGSLEGDYLWSNPGNWSDGVVPVNGDSVTFVGTSTDTSVDDITALSLSSLTLTGSGGLQVSDGSLGIGTVVNNAGDGSGISGHVTPGAATTVAITVGSITGDAGGFYSADGANVSFIDNSPTDPGADYQVYYGATMALAATPAAGSYFEYYDTGTIELEHPGPVTHFRYEIGPGDVLELPGTTVTNASFAAESLTIATNAGTYAVTLSGDGSDLATGYTAEFDPSTGLEAITFTRTDTFENNVTASSGSLAEDYLWSNGSNWTGGVPVNDDAVTFVGTNSDTSVDDLTALDLSSLTLTGKGDLYVPGGSLGIGAVVNQAGVYSGIIADDGGLDVAMPVTVTVGSIAGTGGIYEAYGPNASFVDNSPTDPGATYFPFAGGTVLLNAAPVASTFLEYLGAGTLELEHPGSLTAAFMQGIEPGEVLELPGTMVSSGIFNLGSVAPGGGSFTITTNAGTYTFSNVTERSLVSAYAASYDSVTGLEAVTFAGPEIFEDNVTAASGSLAGDYLWSNPENWSEGVVPLNGDSVTFVGTNNDTSVDDLTALDLSSLTLTGKGDLYVPGGSLAIGTVVNQAGVYSGIIADDGGLDAPAPVTVTVGSISGARGSYEAYGANASFVDNSPTDPGATYFPYGGGTEFLNAAPVASSFLEFIDAGTLELENPSTLITAALQGIEPGEVLELPGTMVSSGIFNLSPSAPGSGSFTITTNAGTYTFSNVTERSLVSAYAASYDSVTGLEAVTFAGPEIFEDNVTAASGLLAGDYLWSNPENWSDGVVPLNGDSVTFVGTNNDTSVDDLTALSLSSLTLTGEGYLYVPGGSLGIGTVVNAAGDNSGIFAADGVLDAPAPVTVTVGSITGAGGNYRAYGPNAGFADNSPTDPGALYFPGFAGTVSLNAAPVASSILEYSGGTLALEHPGSLTNAPIDGIAPGAVLELPGTAVSSAHFNLGNFSGSLTIATNAGTFAFSSVDEDGVSDFTTSFDTVSGLEAITFTGPYLPDLVVPEGQTDIIFSGNTVSNPELAGSTLELESGSTVTGNISFAGTGGELIIEPNADGNTTVPGNEITGFAPGDTIKLAGISFSGTGGPYGAAGEDTYTVATAGTLTIDAAGTIYTLQIEGATVGQHNFVLADDLGITEAACFAAGTRIRTPAGEARIEALRIGDLVTTPEGDAPVLWLGHRTIDCVRHPNPKAVWPVLIRRSAFAEGVPARDLFVSPGHSLYVDGLLMQAEKLCNGATILQIPVPSVTYWHAHESPHLVSPPDLARFGATL